MSRFPVATIINTNPDVVELLKAEIERAGFVVMILHIAEIRLGSLDIDGFLKQHDPRVVVYDVPPPFERNWRFMEHIRSSPGFKGRHFVLTTVNPARLRQIVGTDETVYEVLGEEADIANVVRAVKEASRARPTR
jgi:hypothetical protein